MSALKSSLHALTARLSPAMTALSAFMAWCLVCGGFACRKVPFTQPHFAKEIPLGRLILLFAILCALFLLLGVWRRRYLYRLAPLCALFYGAVCCYIMPSFYTAFGFLILLAILLVYVIREDRVEADGIPCPAATPWVILSLFGVAMAAYLITAALMRYYAYNAPCYDFGIFSQMFHSMRTTGLPVTTCERTEPLSHFAVHVSPIFYLLLPFYMLIPRPETLLVLQVLGVLSGVIPLCLLARHFKLPHGQITVLGVLYLGCAALCGGIFYDFHENKFLTVLLLWLFWAIEKRKWPAVALFALLTLSVKEDAALYIIFIGLWLLLSRPEKKTGAALLLGGAGYFIAVTRWLAAHGDGVMFDRFANIVGPKGGIAELVRAALTNPALLLHECMTADKLVFAACVLLPLGLLPLLCRRLSSLILMCPFVIINLVSDYAYQHNLNFQYTYGVMALLFYLTVANLPHIPVKHGSFRPRRALLCFALCATALVGTVQIKNHSAVFINYDDRREDSALIREVLDTVPDDASVRTASMFAAHLSARTELYYLTNDKEADYVLIDLRPYINITSARGFDAEYFERRGYERVTEIDDVIVLLKKRAE